MANSPKGHLVRPIRKSEPARDAHGFVMGPRFGKVTWAC
jgi:hypothetical protein